MTEQERLIEKAKKILADAGIVCPDHGRPVTVRFNCCLGAHGGSQTSPKKRRAARKAWEIAAEVRREASKKKAKKGKGRRASGRTRAKRSTTEAVAAPA